jgi:chromosome segregation ATPase
MTSRALPLAGLAAAVFALVGCASLTEETESSSGSTASSERSSNDGGSRSTAEAKRSETSSQTAAAAKSDPDAPRSSWRAEREAQRDGKAATTGSNADNAKLVEQLNEASRELAMLRAANAKLKAEKTAPVSSAAARPSSAAATVTAKPEPADEKLAANLKSFTQFKQELATLFAEMDRMRKEYAGLNSSLKAAVEKADQARAAMARLESDLRAEKKSRAEAEQAATQLRDQLRTIARALSSAGLSVEKLSASAETTKR